MQSIEVNQARVDMAVKVIQDKKQLLSETAILVLLVELAEVYKATSYDDALNLKFNFTDLQIVAVAAAMAAAADALGSPDQNSQGDRIG